jgi:hypothetical protein
MLLTPKPASVNTHEENIMWSVCSLISAQANSGLQPPKILEAEGYFASDIVQVTPIRTIDGGYRHVIRVLMPVNPAFYGAAIPVWEFVGDIITP